MEELKVLTYNVDGLPQELDLNNLPWYFKPIIWIYKLFKKTTIIKINDNPNISDNMNKISDYLSKSNTDIIGVQEDFNYHSELVSKLDEYIQGSYIGGFDLHKLKIGFPIRFKTDGLNIFLNKKLTSLVFKEDIVTWEKACGYFKHANDKLTTKGFRYYDVLLNDKYPLNVYVLHMDADYYNPNGCKDVMKDVEARKSQLQQLISYIKSETLRGNWNPILIIGDTNSYNKFSWDKENLELNLIHAINHIKGLTIKEAIPNNFEDCDRIYYINHELADYELTLKECYFDKEVKLSDHFPLIATFEVEEI